MDGVLTLSVSAFGLGVLHALEPGHGKTLMVGSLIGSKRKWLDPLVLAGATAIGHMVGILLFTMISFFLVHEVAAPELKLYLEAVLGALICGIGCWGLCKEISAKRLGDDSCACCSVRSKGNHGTVITRRLSLVGLLVGLVPCPSALALAASTATLGSFSQAVSVAVIFAAGVAVSLLLIGAAITCSADRVRAMPGVEKLARFSKLIAPVSLVLLGVMIVLHAGAHHQ